MPEVHLYAFNGRSAIEFEDYSDYRIFSLKDIIERLYDSDEKKSIIDVSVDSNPRKPLMIIYLQNEYRRLPQEYSEFRTNGLIFMNPKAGLRSRCIYSLGHKVLKEFDLSSGENDVSFDYGKAATFKIIERDERTKEYSRLVYYTTLGSKFNYELTDEGLRLIYKDESVLLYGVTLSTPDLFITQYRSVQRFNAWMRNPLVYKGFEKKLKEDSESYRQRFEQISLEANLRL